MQDQSSIYQLENELDKIKVFGDSGVQRGAGEETSVGDFVALNDT